MSRVRIACGALAVGAALLAILCGAGQPAGAQNFGLVIGGRHSGASVYVGTPPRYYHRRYHSYDHRRPYWHDDYWRRHHRWQWHRDHPYWHRDRW